jgi:multicomponent Na+:H+ antiporter subunit E
MTPTFRTAALRALLFFALWFVLMPSTKAADLGFGLVATAAATWASVRLMPAAAGRVRLLGLLAYLPHFLGHSLLAGVDIARRAFAPRLPLKPGFVTCATRLPPGRARNEFASITSLMPGSVPAGDQPDGVVFHCLDTDQPVAKQIAAEEALLARVLVAGDRHD